MKITNSSVYSVNKTNFQRPACNKSLSFGTNLVQPDNLIFGRKVLEKMNLRNISKKRVIEGIKNGIAFLEEYTRKFLILHKPEKTAQDNRDLVVILDPERKIVITVFHPHSSKYKTLNNGTLVQRAMDRVYYPLSETKTPIITSSKEGHRIEKLADGSILKERIKIPNGYKEYGLDGNLATVKHTSHEMQNGYRIKINTYYYPQEKLIKHKGEMLTEKSDKYTELKTNLFSDFE